METEEEDYNFGLKHIEWYDEEQTSDINQTSLILTLVIGNERFLFTGDAGKEAIKEFITKNSVEQTDISPTS